MTAAVIASVPCHGTNEYVADAVRSLLSQTHRRLTVVVVNDGDPCPPWPALEHLDDGRLVRFDLAANRGRYFADQVVLAATDAEFYLVQDSDDWSAPERVEVLLGEIARGAASGAISARRAHGGREPDRIERWDRLGSPLRPWMQFRATQQGLFRTAALRAVGGFHPGFRVGYDSLLVNLLEMTGRVVGVHSPLYHARRRAGSLTLAPETGWGSPVRRAAATRVRRLYARMYPAYLRHRLGRRPADGLAERIRAVLADTVDEGTTREVAVEAARLRRLLDARPT